MGYVLCGVVGAAAVLQQCQVFAHAVVVPLDQGLWLLPLTDDLRDEIRPRELVGPPFASKHGMAPGFEQLMADWSRLGPVAYVEAEYFGGLGCQWAVVWQSGRLVLGPLMQPDDTPPCMDGQSPVSQALRRLGASADGHVDEFTAVGLGRHRTVEQWLADDG